MIRILIDADACPVVKIAERIAKERTSTRHSTISVRWRSIQSRHLDSQRLIASSPLSDLLVDKRRRVVPRPPRAEDQHGEDRGQVDHPPEDNALLREQLPEHESLLIKDIDGAQKDDQQHREPEGSGIESHLQEASVEEDRRVERREGSLQHPERRPERSRAVEVAAHCHQRGRPQDLEKPPREARPVDPEDASRLLRRTLEDGIERSEGCLIQTEGDITP